MVVSMDQRQSDFKFRSNDDEIDQILISNYLGARIYINRERKNKITKRIGIAKMRGGALSDRKLLLKIKHRLLKTFVWSILLYWTRMWF